MCCFALLVRTLRLRAHLAGVAPLSAFQEIHWPATQRLPEVCIETLLSTAWTFAVLGMEGLQVLAGFFTVIGEGSVGAGSEYRGGTAQRGPWRQLPGWLWELGEGETQVGEVHRQSLTSAFVHYRAESQITYLQYGKSACNSSTIEVNDWS